METKGKINKRLRNVRSIRKKLDKDILRLIDLYLEGIYEKFRDYPNELLDILTLYVNITIKGVEL